MEDREEIRARRITCDTEIVTQMLVAVLDMPRGRSAPDLLGNGFGERAELALTLADFAIGLLKLGGAFADFELECVAGAQDSIFGALAGGAGDRDADGTESVYGNKGAELFGDS